MGYISGQELTSKDNKARYTLSEIELAQKVRDRDLEPLDPNNLEPIDLHQLQDRFEALRSMALSETDVRVGYQIISAGIGKKTPPPRTQKVKRTFPHDDQPRRNWDDLECLLQSSSKPLAVNTRQFREIQEGWGLNIIKEYALPAFYDKHKVDELFQNLEPYTKDEKRNHLLVIFFLIQMLTGKATLRSEGRPHSEFKNEGFMRKYIEERRIPRLSKNFIDPIFSDANKEGKGFAKQSKEKEL
jgi:hypothetical protein